MTSQVKLVCTECGQANRIPENRLRSGPRCGVCGAALADGRVLTLDALSHDKAMRTDDLPLLVDYWAPWCGPCLRMAPEFESAARRLGPAIRFARLNTEDHPQISARVGIRGIPALVLYHGGREIARLSGLRPAAEIENFVRPHLASPVS
ncbi:MAG: thioredoxin TrxC [Tabrizicola sp.]|nr:thioredoxin TrxC [Tabrizicola sp.]